MVQTALQLKWQDEIRYEFAIGSLVTIIHVLYIFLHRDMMEMLTF
jgi:hypothetical protein